MANDARTSMPQLTITPVLHPDQDAAAALLVAQMAEHRIELEPQALLPIIAQICTDERNGIVLVAKLDNTIVGIAYLAIILSIEHAGPVGWLEELYVAPDHRQRGIGTELLNAVIAEARNRGLLALDLEVDVHHQRAEAFYARFGFRSLPRSRWVKKLYEADAPTGLGPVLESELEARYRQFLANPTEGESWEIVRERIRKHLDGAKPPHSL
jgi:GNAT superfamily N-acetyltransferase